ncbi:hypothetical protein CHU32_26040 [Superficieibacter electus]|uniref:Sel1 repeat family protein n=1 Tax=Superficieibacter electus TaxID=2022662 RepID=A0A2P5GHD2_9ENTR|nr:tetratricopeptide repeat protein [Superficieibacter electus]POP40643.1 hypothetical protein CHU33_26125 [Superficieibacter electus]POP41807.1 hypothetical protein CHU32_26040 [Superficieibacter electus]
MIFYYQQGEFVVNKKKNFIALILCSSIFINYANATDVPTLEQHIKVGDTKAQYELGLKYLNGEGVEINYLKGSVLVYASALSQKNESLIDPLHLSKAPLWQRYEIVRLGEQIARNPDEWKKLWVNTSVDELNKLAKKGDASALYHVGILSSSAEDAFKIFEQAAIKNNRESQVVLAQLYDRGLGVERNDKKSFEWTQKAAEQGDVNSQMKMYRYYLGNFGDIVKIDYHKASEWIQKAIDQGDGDAMETKGWDYASGRNGIPKDINKGIEIYKKGLVAKLTINSVNFTDYNSLAYMYLKNNDKVKAWVLLQMGKKVAAEMNTESILAEEDADIFPVLSIKENPNAKNVLSTTEGQKAQQQLAALEKDPSSIAGW